MVAAGFWLASARAEVRDSMDHFIEDLRKVSRLNARGALAAVVSALCASALFGIAYL